MSETDSERREILSHVIEREINRLAQVEASPFLSLKNRAACLELQAEGLKVFPLTGLLRQHLLSLAPLGSERRLQLHFDSIYERLFYWMKEIGALAQGPQRARVVHILVDSALRKSEEAEKPLLSCRKGCSSCCHTPVSLSESEGELIWEALEGDEVLWDRDKAMRQKAKPSPSEVSWEESACVFLNRAGECQIYSVRPASCRKVLVLSDPLLCDPRDENEPSYFVSLEAEIIAAALYNIERRADGTLALLPEMMSQDESRS